MQAYHKVLFSAFMALSLAACKHPLEIVGEGDIISGSGTRDCLLEDYQASLDNCASNLVVEAYNETYTAEPRPGWAFSHWEGYPDFCQDNAPNSCTFSVSGDLVSQSAGAVARSLRAVFTRAAPELVELTTTDIFDTPGNALGIAKSGQYIYIADNTAQVKVLTIDGGSGLVQVAEIPLTAAMRGQGLAVDGNYLYVAGGTGGFSVVDVSEPLAATEVYFTDTASTASYITIVDQRLYLSDRQGLLVFDIANPLAPVEVWSEYYPRFAFLRSSFDGTSLVFAGFGDGVRAYSLGAGDAPVQQWSFNIEPKVWSVDHHTDPGTGDSYVLLGGESAGFSVYDPVADAQVGSTLQLTSAAVSNTVTEKAWDIVSQGKYAFVANGDNGIQVVDLEDPENPFITAELQTGGSVRDVLVEGDIILVAAAGFGVHLIKMTVQPDQDQDGIVDSDDEFPTDPLEWRDTDGDGIGNNADPDDDNDGIEDLLDDDIDGDGYANAQDAYPEDARYWIDSDGDGKGDNTALLLVDNDSVHADSSGGWTVVQSSAAKIGSSYLAKSADSTGDFVRWRPIINRAGRYNVYYSAMFTSNGAIDQVSSFEIETDGSITDLYRDVEANLRSWNWLGEYFFSQGNEGTITLFDDGDGSADVYGDATLLIPSLTVPDTFVSNFGYSFVGNYTNPNLAVWNLKRLLQDPVDATVVWGAFNSTADLCSIDVTDPTSPALMNCYISEDDGAGYEMIRNGDYMYLADRYAGVRVFEITGRGEFQLTKTIPTYDKASRIVLHEGILYVGDTLAGVLTYDVSDASSPVFLDRIEIGAESRDLRVKGDYAFVSNYYRGMTVINVADPADMSYVTRLKEPWNAFLGGVWDMELDGDLLYMLVQSFGVQITDVSDPTAPVVISEIRIPNGREFDFNGEVHADQPPLGIEKVNNLLIVANGAHGVLLFDVEDIGDIKLLDRIDTPSVAGEAKLYGSHLYVADGQGSGLQIYDITAYSEYYDPPASAE